MWAGRRTMGGEMQAGNQPLWSADDGARRVLVVDDNESTHRDVRRILIPDQAADRLGELEVELGLSEAGGGRTPPRYIVDVASQGGEAVELVRSATAQDQPYMLAFVDMRMPPGWDGLQTIERIWELDLDVQIVLCTAFSDYTAGQIEASLGRSDRLVFLRKPFETLEVHQLAFALTEKWRMTQDARLQRKMLEDLLAIRTDSLRTARDELLSFSEELATARSNATAAQHLREEFIHEVAKEIRNPMSGVVGMTNLLMDTNLDRKQIEYVETVSRSADMLLERLSNVLDKVNLESDQLEIEHERFDLVRTVEQAVERCVQTAAKKGIELAMQIDSRVPSELEGDGSRIAQVLGLLIGNAIKYTYNGHVLVSMRVHETDALGLPLVIAVEDSGIGMGQDFAAQVFDAELDDTGQPTGSVGLPLAYRLVEKLGGQLAVASQEGLGSVFSMHLPFDLDTPMTELDLPVQRLRDADVLVVSPRAIVRRLLHDLLGSWQVHSAMALSLDDAYEVIQEGIEDGELFDMILVDQHASTTAGPELANAMKDPHRIGDIPTVILGDPTCALSMDEVREARFAAYLMKPLRPHRLALVMDRVMDLAERGERALALTEADLQLPAPVSRRPWREPRPTWARILVAEDNEVSQKVACSMLEKLGCAVDAANDGRQALSLIQRQDYDLILMDCVMPFMDGYEAAEHIRTMEAMAAKNDAECRRTPILAMTVDGSKQAKSRSEAAGMDGMLVKPVRLLDLQECLENWLDV